MHSQQALQSNSILEFVLLRGDPGYYSLNYISAKLGASVYLLNFVCALIFMIGIAIFCRSTPRPLLSLASAFPYLIVVVAMGYTRQSVAISMIMISITYLIRNKVLHFIFFIFLGMLFHKTAIIFLGMGLFVISKNRFLNIILVIFMGIIAYFTLLEAYLEKLIWAYITSDQQSSGALIRLSMNFIPAFLLLLLYKRMVFSKIEIKLYLLMALTSLALLAMYFIFDISTALDRIGLYMIPLQLVVFSRIPDLFTYQFDKALAYTMIFLYLLTILTVWMNFAGHSYLWIPYKNILMGWE